MENTIENKAKFLQNYIGIGISMVCIAKNFTIPDRILNGVIINDKKQQTLYLTKDGCSDLFSANEWVAELRPLSSITDEDAIEVANIFNLHHLSGAVKDLIKSIIIALDGTSNKSATTEFVSNWAESIDYLRSKGYALPWIGLSVKQQIEYGWVKLTNPQQ